MVIFSRLFVIFNVAFPSFLPPNTVAALAQVLPKEPEQQHQEGGEAEEVQWRSVDEQEWARMGRTAMGEVEEEEEEEEEEEPDYGEEEEEGEGYEDSGDEDEPVFKKPKVDPRVQQQYQQ